MKFALLQLNLLPGDIRGNAARIAAAVRGAAAAGADLCVTSDLALCGPGPQNLLSAEGFVETCRSALHDLARDLADAPPVLVGAPIAAFMPGDERVRHAAVLLEAGRFSITAHKPFAFSTAEDADRDAFHHGFARGLITVRGWRVGVILCDTAWEERLFRRSRKPDHQTHLQSAAAFEADALVHLGAAPFSLGMQQAREQRLAHMAALHHVHFFSVNPVGGNGEDVFYGRSLAVNPEGLLLARGKIFEEDCVIVDAAPPGPARPPEADKSGRMTEEDELWGALCLGVRDYVRKSGFTGVVLGLSGGLDSAVTAAVAAEALGGENVLGALLPSPWTSGESLRCAGQLADNLGIRRITLPITPLMDAYAAALAPAFAVSPAGPQDTTEENIQPRIRCTLLMALANKYGLLLLNTSNKSEIAVGYSTLYGDAAGALSVLGDVYKTEVYALARRCNAVRGRAVIPRASIDRPPSAELKAGQLDSDCLPPYALLDPLLARLIGEKTPLLPRGEGLDEAGEGLSDDIYARIRRAEFKRRQSPPVLRVSTRVFGRDWRLPLISA